MSIRNKTKTLLLVIVTVITLTLVQSSDGHKTTSSEVEEIKETQEKEEKEIDDITIAEKEDNVEWKYPELKRICSCESTGTPNNEPIHYNKDGSVLRGKINPQDIGQCQINLYYHGDTAIKLGIDLYTPEGNIDYAEYLYETQGSDPWLWSSKCWM